MEGGVTAFWGHYCVIRYPAVLDHSGRPLLFLPRGSQQNGIVSAVGWGERTRLCSPAAPAATADQESGRPSIIAKSLARARFALSSCPSLDAFLRACLPAWAKRAPRLLAPGHAFPMWNVSPFKQQGVHTDSDVPTHAPVSLFAETLSEPSASAFTFAQSKRACRPDFVADHLPSR